MSRTSERRARRTQALRKTGPAQGGLQNRNLWVIGGAAVVVLALLIIGVNVLGGSKPVTATPVAGDGTPDPGSPTLDPSVKLGVEVSVPNMGGQHVAVGQPHAKYNSTPPTSGPHYDTPAPWGDSHTTLPEETWVHNMEHGGIVALYNCPQGCPGLVQSLDDFLKTGPFSNKYGYMKMVVTPYNKIPNKLTLVAWNFYLPLADYDDAAMRKFLKDHQDNGPEDVP